MKKIIAITALLLLTACTEPGQHILFGEAETYELGESNLFPNIEHRYYTVFIEDLQAESQESNRPEPPMLGLLSEDAARIAQEEHALGVSHDVIAHTMRLDGEFPKLWMLEMISERKLPLIIVEPPQEGTVFDRALLEENARRFGQFPVPMLVAFYPVTSQTNFAPAEYIAFFRFARVLFNQHVPSAEFVWLTDTRENFMDFYPGELAADWVGISAELYEEGLWEQIAEIYHSFPDTPIMLNLAVSHLSAATHRYRVTEAAENLHAAYGSIAAMPRIRLVNYLNINRLREGAHDFRISIEPALREAYREAALALQTAAHTNKRPSRFGAIEQEGRVYLDLRTITEELGRPEPDGMRFAAGAMRVDAEAVGALVCHVEGRVVVW